MSLVVAVVGPTAVGKSRLGTVLARTFNGEIVSADSRQVYRYMDIGTAKPAPEERSKVPHHLIDIVNPDESFSVAVYQSLAMEVIEQIMQRGRVPVLVGGSGLYVWSVLEGWEIPRVLPDAEFRRHMEKRAAVEGGMSLYRELEKIDQVAARSIDPRNIRRVIRALEVCRARQISEQQQLWKKNPPFEVLIVGLTADRRALYEMIDLRVDEMIGRGLVDEVRGLLSRGYGPELPAMSSVGYKEICEFLDGRVDLVTAVRKIKFETHRLARHQYAWFRLRDPRIRWFDVADRVESRVLEFVGGHSGR